MLIVLSSMVRFQNGRVPLTMILVVVLYLGQEVYDGIMIADGVSQLTHVLGGVCGGVFGWILNTQRDKLQKWM
jgi:membrane associated rhomboid family serine protease